MRTHYFLEDDEVVGRTVCDCLTDLRKCFETRNFSYMISLIEEAQSGANRMENTIWDQKAVTRLREEYKELKEEVKKLRTEKKHLGGDHGDKI